MGFFNVFLLVLVTLFSPVAINSSSTPTGNTDSTVVKRARDTERKNDVHAIHTQLELFYATNGFYPSSLNVLPNLTEDNLKDPNGSAYFFKAQQADGSICLTSQGNCEEYQLKATLETKAEPFSLNSLNGTPDSD